MYNKLIFVFLIFAFVKIFSEEYTVDNAKSSIKIIGTSTLHDWEVDVVKINGKMVLDNDGLPKSLISKCKVKDLQSDKEKMNNLMHEALNEEEHPTLTFDLGSITKSNDGKLKAKGRFTINGVTKTKSITVSEKSEGTNKTYSGDISFKMSEFDVEPPSLFFGTLNTGDEITLEIKISFVKLS